MALGHHGGTDGWISFKCTFYKWFPFSLLNIVTKTDVEINISRDKKESFLFVFFYLRQWPEFVISPQHMLIFAILLVHLYTSHLVESERIPEDHFAILDVLEKDDSVSV